MIPGLYGQSSFSQFRQHNFPWLAIHFAVAGWAVDHPGSEMMDSRSVHPVLDSPMPGSAKIFSYIPTTSFERAQAFYGGVLGLNHVSTDDFALVFESGGIRIRVA
jgi:hypothetical protein